jgi:hypothetical protein
MYEHQSYPSVRYHRVLDPVLVLDPAHERAVAPAPVWADTPAAFVDDVDAIERMTHDEPAASRVDAAPARRKR